MNLPATTAASVGSNFSKWFLVEESRRLVAIDLGALSREVLVDSSLSGEVTLVALEFGTIVLVQTQTEEAGFVLQMWQTDGTGSGRSW